MKLLLRKFIKRFKIELKKDSLHWNDESSHYAMNNLFAFETHRNILFLPKNKYRTTEN